MDYINRKALVPLYQLIEKITTGAIDVLDWSQIKNRPFYDETVYENVEWDGRTEGLLSFTVEKEDGSTLTYYKCSDQVLSYDDLFEFLDYEYPEEIKVGVNCCYIPGWFIAAEGSPIEIGEYNNGSDIVIPAAGTYLCNANAGIVYKKKPVKLDNKYINTATPGMAGIAIPTFYTADMTLPVGVDSKGCLWAAKPKISEKDIMISSSTEGSTKKFRIQIDDDGNISAVEVKNQ